MGNTRTVLVLVAVGLFLIGGFVFLKGQSDIKPINTIEFEEVHKNETTDEPIVDFSELSHENQTLVKRMINGSVTRCGSLDDIIPSQFIGEDSIGYLKYGNRYYRLDIISQGDVRDACPGQLPGWVGGSILFMGIMFLVAGLLVASYDLYNGFLGTIEQRIGFTGESGVLDEV